MRKQPGFDAPRPRVPPGTRLTRRAYALATAAMGLVILTDGRTASAAVYNITVDAARQTAGNPRFWAASVGTGTASLTLRADLQTHYKLENRELGMQRVRGHGVLNDDMGIYRGPGSYDWTKFDTYLDAIVSAGMRPIMELSFMPTALGLTGSSRDFPNDINAYRQLIQAVVQHCVDRFGAADVGQWYWEVWNEPDYPGFWNGRNATEAVAAKMTDYYALYDAAVDGATAVLPNILIGGPATTEPSKIAAFLQHCRTANKRVTFVSSHVYPGGNGTSPANATILVNDNNTRLSQITAGGYTTATVKSFNTEWNSAYTGQGANPGDANLSMDNHWNAGFILKGVKLLSDRNQGETPPLDVFSYWVASDIFDESSGPSGSYILGQGGNLPFGRVFGLMTFQGVRKAAFNALRMLSYLGPRRLLSGGGTGGDGVDAMATMSANNDELQILVYNYFATLNTIGSDTVNVNVSNLPATLVGKELFVTHFRVDESHSNPYSVWASQGSPTNPSEAQWQAMRQAQHLALLQPVSKTTVSATYTTSFTLPRQAGSLVIVGLNRPVTGRNAFVEIEGEDYDGQSGATKQDSNDAGLGQSIVGNSGSTVYFENVDLSDAGVTAVQLRVALQSDATLELHASSPTGPVLGTCALTATAGAWATQTCMVTQTAGVLRVYVSFGGTVRLNWMKFQGAGGGAGTGNTGGGETGGTGVIGGAGGAGGITSGGMSSGGSNGTGNGTGTIGSGSGGNFGSGGSPPFITGGGKPSGCACDIGGNAGWPSGTLLIGGLVAAVLSIRTRTARRRPR
jgi:xylan 1,4-beta-xylosidase